MARQRIITRTKTTTVKKIRSAKTITDSKGRVHCTTCGAYVGTKGKKK